MNNSNASSSQRGTVVGKKSWTAYVTTVTLTLMLLVSGIGFCFSEMWPIGCLIIVVSLVFCIHHIYALQSYQIIIDKHGVWIFSGVLPWTKGFTGVKWRDLAEAFYDQSLIGWRTKSYTIHLTHRFTKTEEITMYDTDHGNEVVELINRVHIELLKEDLIKGV